MVSATLKDAQIAKKRLEKGIADLLQVFHKNTGLDVTDLDVLQIRSYGKPPEYLVRAKCELID